MAIMFTFSKSNKFLTVIFVLLTMMLLVGATQIANKTVHKVSAKKNSLESLQTHALSFVKEASLGAKDTWSNNIKRSPVAFIKINSSHYSVLNEQ